MYNTHFTNMGSVHTLYMYMYLFSSSLDLAKQFQEEAYSVSVHPSGLFLLVGFSEKLRLMNVLIDDIRPFKEFMIRGCREVTIVIIMSLDIITSVSIYSVHSVMVVTCLLQLMPILFNYILPFHLRIQ